MKYLISFFICLCHFSIFSEEKLNNELIKKFILQNPEIIIESLQKYEQSLEKENVKKVKELISSNIDEIKKNNINFFSGNIKSQNIIYEFFDYNCGYCKRAHDEIKKVIKNNDVKVIFINSPILSDDSLKLAKLSIVIGEINNVYFNKFHEFLLSSKKSEKEIKQFIKKLSLDYEKLIIESESKFVAGIINKNLEWAKLFKIRGTPAFIVKGELINGFVGSSILESLLFD